VTRLDTAAAAAAAAAAADLVARSLWSDTVVAPRAFRAI